VGASAAATKGAGALLPGYSNSPRFSGMMRSRAGAGRLAGGAHRCNCWNSRRLEIANRDDPDYIKMRLVKFTTQYMMPAMFFAPLSTSWRRDF
jgi:hypothetical protein